MAYKQKGWCCGLQTGHIPLMKNLVRWVKGTGLEPGQGVNGLVVTRHRLYIIPVNLHSHPDPRSAGLPTLQMKSLGCRELRALALPKVAEQVGGEAEV